MASEPSEGKPPSAAEIVATLDLIALQLRDVRRWASEHQDEPGDDK